MKIAVIGGGISGLTAAHLLAKDHEVTLFEACDQLGGHACTHDVQLDGRPVPVETGFVVHNRAGYPHFCALLESFAVDTRPVAMSLSVHSDELGIEFSAANPQALRQHASGNVGLSLIRLLKELRRFVAELPAYAQTPDYSLTLSECVEPRYSEPFLRLFLYPVVGAVCCYGIETVRSRPAAFVGRFFERYGYFDVEAGWHAFTGGSRAYVEALVARTPARMRTGAPVASVRRHAKGVEVELSGGEHHRVDAVVLAIHADTALGLLADPSEDEKKVLSAFPYVTHSVVLHTDASLMPSRRENWASWNYYLAPSADNRLPMVTYYMNLAQGLDAVEPVFVTLNRDEAVDPARVLRRYQWSTPLFEARSLAAQPLQTTISGQRNTYYCGAYWDLGAHEDGVCSARVVAEQIARWSPPS